MTRAEVGQSVETPGAVDGCAAPGGRIHTAGTPSDVVGKPPTLRSGASGAALDASVHGAGAGGGSFQGL